MNVYKSKGGTEPKRGVRREMASLRNEFQTELDRLSKLRRAHFAPFFYSTGLAFVATCAAAYLLSNPWLAGAGAVAAAAAYRLLSRKRLEQAEADLQSVWAPLEKRECEAQGLSLQGCDACHHNGERRCLLLSYLMNEEHNRENHA